MRKEIILLLFLLLTNMFFAQNPGGFNCQIYSDTCRNFDPTDFSTGELKITVLPCVELFCDSILLKSDFEEFVIDVERYFDDVTFGNYNIVVDTMIFERDTTSFFELYSLSDTVVARPPNTMPQSEDFVIQPDNLTELLNRVDIDYDFNAGDHDNDGYVDMLAVLLVKFHGGYNNGTVGLPIGSFITNDTFNDTYIEIDGGGYGGSGSLSYDYKATIQRFNYSTYDDLVRIVTHELGHAVFKLPDYDYGIGSFDIMAKGGFGIPKLASMFNPYVRAQYNWIETIPLNPGILEPEPLTVSNKIYEHNKFLLSYHVKDLEMKWEQNWPVPFNQSLNVNRGILIWTKGDYFESKLVPAHGRWDWDLHADNERDEINGYLRAINLGTENPFTGVDSLNVNHAYLWEERNTSGTWQWHQLYPDSRIGSESCFFTPEYNNQVNFNSNPNSNTGLYISGTTYYVYYNGFEIDDIFWNNNELNIDVGGNSEGKLVVQEDITLTEFGYRFLGGLEIAPGVTLTVPVNTRIELMNGDLNVYGNLIVEEGALFKIWDGNVNIYGALEMSGNENSPIQFINDEPGRIILHENSTTNLSYVNLGHDRGIFSSSQFNSLNVENCEFSEYEEGIVLSNFRYSDVIINNNIFNADESSESVSIRLLDGSNPIIANNEFICNQPIKTWNISNIYIKNNKLEGAGGNGATGMYLSNSSCKLVNNEISDFDNGIYLVNSDVELSLNDIYGCMYNGLYASTGSVADLRYTFIAQDGRPGYLTSPGRNYIFENGNSPSSNGSEIFMNSSELLMEDGWNYVYDNRASSHGLNTLILIDGAGNELPVIAYNNCWGFNPEATYPGDRFLISIQYDLNCLSLPKSNFPEYLIIEITDEIRDTVEIIESDSINLSLSSKLFANGEYKYLRKEYSEALDIFNQVLFLSEEVDKYTIKSLVRILDVLRTLNSPASDFIQIYNYIEQLKTITEDSNLRYMLEQISRMTLINGKDYYTAIEEFDQVIINNPGSDESFFAEIDAITSEYLALVNGTPAKVNNTEYQVKNYAEFKEKIDGLMKEKFGSKNRGESGSLPLNFILGQNYPNPFNPATNINFSLPVKAKVTLEIFNALGQKVSTLANGDMQAGIHTVNFDAASLASGIYFYTISVDGVDGSSFNDTKKMLLLK